MTGSFFCRLDETNDRQVGDLMYWTGLWILVFHRMLHWCFTWFFHRPKVRRTWFFLEDSNVFCLLELFPQSNSSSYFSYSLQMRDFNAAVRRQYEENMSSNMREIFQFCCQMMDELAGCLES